MKLGEIIARARKPPNEERVRTLSREIDRMQQSKRTGALGERLLSRKSQDLVLELANPLYFTAAYLSHGDIDLMMDVLAVEINEVLKNCSKIAAANSPIGMARTIISRAAKSYMRREIRKSTKTAPLQDNLPEEETEETLFDILFDGDLCRMLSWIRAHLNEREYFVLVHYYGVGTPRMKLQDIAEVLDLTTARISQIKQQAIQKLKDASVHLVCDE